MAGRDDFFSEFYNEAMLEMAGNFFSRRKEVEGRLERFRGLADEVRSAGVAALRRWRTFFLLLLEDDRAREFLRQGGADLPGLPALAATVDAPWRFKTPFGWTGKSRYRKSVAFSYRAAWEATREYLEGGYCRDPRNPMKKCLTPNYATLKRLAEAINKEVAAVNTGQTPATVLGYVKSLDTSELARESVTGGLLGEDFSKIDRDMAFNPIDFPALNLPDLLLPKPLEAVEDALDALCAAVYEAHPEDAAKALAALNSAL